MFIPDLKEYPAGYPPDPDGYGVEVPRGARGVLPPGTRLLAVGWLGDHVAQTGETFPDCIERLFLAYERGMEFGDFSRGWHDCELCATSPRTPGYTPKPIVRWRGRELAVYGHGHFLVQWGADVYMCPALILHYILGHRYQPPAAFVTAVIEGRFLGPDDLVVAGEPGASFISTLMRQIAARVGRRKRT